MITSYNAVRSTFQIFMAPGRDAGSFRCGRRLAPAHWALGGEFTGRCDLRGQGFSIPTATASALQRETKGCQIWILSECVVSAGSGTTCKSLWRNVCWFAHRALLLSCNRLYIDLPWIAHWRSIAVLLCSNRSSAFQDCAWLQKKRLAGPN